MKKSLLTIFFWLVAVASMAQAVAHFTPEVKDLGIIPWRRPATITYKVHNAGTSPLMISNVTTSCGCTQMQWTETAIAPNEEGTVTVVFDAEAIGTFYKEVGVYCNASNEPIYLYFKGTVAWEEERPAVELPYAIGEIGVSDDEIEFADVVRGAKPTFELTVQNNSKQPFSPVLMHLPPYLSAQAYPETIGKGKSGKVVLTLNTDLVPKLGITTSSVYLARFSGDKVSADNELPLTIVLLPDFTRVSGFEKAHPPVMELSATELDFGTVRADTKPHQDITIVNKGRTTLRINQMQVFTIGLSVKLKKRELRPGERVKMRVTVLGDNLQRLKNTPRILMITNDPKQPKVSIKIKANPQR